MSHEIRTPLNAVLGIAEVQLQNETLNQDVKEAFTRIFNSGDLLLGIICPKLKRANLSYCL